MIFIILKDVFVLYLYTIENQYINLKNLGLCLKMKQK